MTRLKAAIAAGHGGRKRGAMSADGRLVESVYTLALADKVARLLDASDVVQPFRVRTEDIDLTNGEEADCVRRAACAAAATIHVNSYPGHVRPETLVLHRPGDQQSRELGMHLVDRLRLAARQTRVALADSRYPGAVAVLAPYPRIPVVVFECGYASESQDVDWLLANQDLLAESIALGFDAWASDKEP